MIVRDESAVITRCLDSVRDLIDQWVVCDTGSRDGTPAIIRSALAGLPGELHERPWVDFGHNRSELMELARGSADYLLLIDADMVVVSSGPLPRLTADAYLVTQETGGVRYGNKRLVRGDLPWRYVGSTHEFIECPGREEHTERLEQLWIADHGDGGHKQDKFERDRRLLSAELAAEPDDPRATFYLAQTLRDMAGQDRRLLEQSLALYRRRTELGGWTEEIYCAWHEAGKLAARLGRWPEALDAFLWAQEVRPERAEAAHDLVIGLLERRQYQAAYRFTRDLGVTPLPRPEDILFLQPWVYDWGMGFQHVIAAYWVGDYDGAIATARWLLDRPDLPDPHREQARRNVDFAIRRKLERVRAERGTWAHGGVGTRGR